MMKIKELYLWIIIFLCLIVIIIQIINLNKNGFECLNDPLTFGANELQKLNTEEIKCQCSSGTPGEILYFDARNKTILIIK